MNPLLPTSLEGQLGSAKFMPISFLILTYNSSSYIYSLLDSLIEKVGKEIQDGEYEIVILDNASEDDTMKKIKEYFKKKEIKTLQIITSKINLGYAKGINLAAKSASGEILIVVNPDGKLIKANFKQVISEFKSNTKIAIAGMRLVDSYGISEKTAGRFYNAFTFLLFTIGLEEIFGLRFAPSKFEQVDFVSGGF
ncbi:MAG: glycosyltransferase, partial [Ferruginibacter sp.]